MDTFEQFCKRFSPLTDEALRDLLGSASSKKFRKGQYVIRKNQVCKHVYFVDEGLLKMFFLNDEKQFVMRFFSEGVMFSAFNSYVPQTPSRLMLIALENTILTMISYEQMEQLCRKHHCIETFFRKLISIAAVKMTKRISEMLEGNASVRYHQFVSEHKNLVQRISLADISNYLGITQQSLSRIRAGK